jgi:heavy metal sensor kinase
MGFFLYSSLRSQLYQSVDDGLRIRADQLLGVIDDESKRPRFDSDETPTLNLREDMARLVSPSGTVLDSLGNDSIPLVSSTIGNDESRFVTFPCSEVVDGQGKCEEFQIFRLLTLPYVVDGNTVAYLQVGRDIESVQEALTRLLRLLLISGPILVGVASLGGYWLSGQALAPIEKIRRQAAAIHAKDLSQRLNLATTDDEVGRLAHTFNEMLVRLEESFLRQRRFTADASHELRTPLAVIRGEIDVALERPRSAEEYVETLEVVGMEAQRMSRLVNELLLLARADAEEIRLEYEQVDLADLLKLLLEQMQRPAKEAQVSLKADLPPSLPMIGDRDRLLELFINLVENGLIYAPASQMDVQARSAGENIVVTITDSGPGIPEEHLPHIFERFYRVDQARGQSSDGSGLGLAIAQEIAHAHGGHISVQSKEDMGTTFTVQLHQNCNNGKSEMSD